MSEEEKPKRTRLYVLVALTLVAWGLLVATDNGNLKALATCVVQGDVAIEEVDGRKFDIDYFGMTYSGTLDNWVDISVYFWGAHEKPNLFAMRDVLAQTNPTGDGVFVDVGANVGTHAMFMSKHAKSVRAVEPWPTVIKRLHHHIESNKLSNVTIDPVGFGNEAGTMPFHAPPGWNLGWGSFSDSFATEYDKKGDVIDLPIVVADVYFPEKGVNHVDMIKIDIEGYEKPALQGFKQILERDQPTVIFELNVRNDEGFHSEEDLRGTFPKDYEFWEVTQPGKLSWQVSDKKHVVCKYEEGRYDFVRFDMTFERGNRDIFAMPKGVREKMD